MFEPLFTPLFSSLFSPLFAAIQRIFIDLDPVLESHYVITDTLVFLNGDKFEFEFLAPSGTLSSLQYLVDGDDANNRANFLMNATGKLSFNTAMISNATLDGASIIDGVTPHPMDSKLHSVVLTLNTGAKIKILGARFSLANFYDGIIANVDGGNGNAWRLDRATGNTEQAAGGGNDLTYNNAPASTRELFTFIDGEWVGVERVVNGVFDTAAGWIVGVDWAISGGVLTATNPDGTFTTQSSVNEIGNTFSVEYDITRIASGQFHVRCGFSDSGTSPVSAVGHVKQTSVAGGNDTLFITTAGATDGDIDNVSVKRFIEVA